MGIDHIVWDWNGTLFDDGDVLVQATIDAFAACGLPEVTLDRYRAHFRRPIPEFYNRLAGRTLTLDEHALVNQVFLDRYALRIATATVRADAVRALTAWREAGRTQSLLSMHPHEQLTAMPQVREIAGFFNRIDGMAVATAHKEPLLRQHVDALDVDTVVIVGDNVDDMYAARACGFPSVLFHPRDGALLSDDRVRALAVPVARDLSHAVTLALAGSAVPASAVPVRPC